MVDGVGETGGTAHEPPLSGRVVVADADDLQATSEVVMRNDAGRWFLQLRRASVQLVERAHPDRDLGVWTDTGTNGFFSFSSAQLATASTAAGRTLAVGDLALLVHAGEAGYVQVQHGDGSPLAFTTWRFSVHDGDGTGGHAPVALGPDMWIEVPQWTEDHPLLEAYGSAATPQPYSGTQRSDEPITGWRAFFACALLMAQRGWFYDAYLQPRRHDDPRPPSIPAVTVIYPGNPCGSQYTPGHRLFLGKDFGASSLAHEFGHAIALAAAPDQPAPMGGQHSFTERSTGGFGDADHLEMYRQQSDFWEGYASFVGQAFLRDSYYDMSAEEGYDLETPDTTTSACRQGYGDWCTASYLWDLIDPARTVAADRRRSHGATSADDDVALDFGTVHALYRSFSVARGAHRHALALFHDHLCAQRPELATQLAAILAANHLTERHASWIALDGRIET